MSRVTKFGGNTLDQAYNEGGAGAGRQVVVDSGAVFFDGSTIVGNTDVAQIYGNILFDEQTADPVAPTPNQGRLYTKDSAGITQLFYHDSAGVVHQITPAGAGNNTLDMAYDQGGPGAGRIINVDSGSVELVATATQNPVFQIDNITTPVTADKDLIALGIDHGAGIAVGRFVNGVSIVSVESLPNIAVASNSGVLVSFQGLTTSNLQHVGFYDSMVGDQDTVKTNRNFWGVSAQLVDVGSLSYGIHIDHTGVGYVPTFVGTHDGIFVQMPAVYLAGAFIRGIRVEGDGRTVDICNDIYAGEFTGDVLITGKLTVTGAIDPTWLGLNEQALDPAAVANIGKVYTKDVAGTTHLFYQDDIGGVHQLTPPVAGVTLDGAYDFGGLGAGRVINADSGAVEIDVPVGIGAGGALLLDLDNLVNAGVYFAIDIDASGMTQGGFGIPVMLHMNYTGVATGAGIAYGIYIEPGGPNSGHPIFVDISSMSIGQIFRVESGAMALTGNLTGISFDLASNITPGAFAIEGINVAVPRGIHNAIDCLQGTNRFWVFGQVDAIVKVNSNPTAPSTSAIYAQQWSDALTSSGGSSYAGRFWNIHRDSTIQTIQDIYAVHGMITVQDATITDECIGFYSCIHGAASSGGGGPVVQGDSIGYLFRATQQNDTGDPIVYNNFWGEYLDLSGLDDPTVVVQNVIGEEVKLQGTIGAGLTWNGYKLSGDGVVCGAGETFHGALIDIDGMTVGGNVYGINILVPGGTSALTRAINIAMPGVGSNISAIYIDNATTDLATSDRNYITIDVDMVGAGNVKGIYMNLDEVSGMTSGIVGSHVDIYTMVNSFPNPVVGYQLSFTGTRDYGASRYAYGYWANIDWTVNNNQQVIYAMYVDMNDMTIGAGGAHYVEGLRIDMQTMVLTGTPNNLAGVRINMPAKGTAIWLNNALVDVGATGKDMIYEDIDVLGLNAAAHFRGSYFNIDETAIGTDGSFITGYEALMTGFATGRADLTGFKVTFDGAKSGGDITCGMLIDANQTISNSAEIFYGINVDMSGMVTTDGIIEGLQILFPTGGVIGAGLTWKGIDVDVTTVACGAGEFLYGAHLNLSAMVLGGGLVYGTYIQMPAVYVSGTEEGVRVEGDGRTAVLCSSKYAADFTGDVLITGKLTVTGLVDPTGIKMTEQSSDPGATGSGEGTYWVEDAVPTVPKFTDDIGIDHDLSLYGHLTEQPLIGRYVAILSSYCYPRYYCNAQRWSCADSNGNRYFAYLDPGAGTLMIVKIQPDMQRFIYETPIIPEDFTLQINSLDELVVVYCDYSDLYVTKCDVAALAGGIAWQGPTQVSVFATGTSFGADSAIDSQDRIWIFYQDMLAAPPCPTWYAVYNVSVGGVAPAAIQVETAVPAWPVTPYAGAYALEIDSNDYCHVCYAGGALPGLNIFHTYCTAPAVNFTAVPVQLETVGGCWWGLSMVIDVNDRVIVTSLDGNMGGYWGTYIDSPWVAAGLDPCEQIDLGWSFEFTVASDSPIAHQIGLNAYGEIVHVVLGRLQGQNFVWGNAFCKTDTSLTPDDIVGGYHNFQIYVDNPQSGQSVHWCKYFHNRPGYDLPLAFVLSEKIYMSGGSPVSEYIWERIGE